jgi:hypothetical protein
VEIRHFVAYNKIYTTHKDAADAIEMLIHSTSLLSPMDVKWLTMRHGAASITESNRYTAYASSIYIGLQVPDRITQLYELDINAPRNCWTD